MLKLSRSEYEKQTLKRDMENGNAESKEKGTCLETDSKANVRSDSRLKEDVDLGTEQSSRPRKKKKMKGNRLIDEKKTDSFVESSGLKEEGNSLTKETLSERKSNVRSLENTGSDSGLKEELNGSERKRKRKRKNKMAKMDAVSVLELKDKQENSLMDEHKVSDSPLDSKSSVGLLSGLKNKVENTGLGILEDFSLEPGLEGAQLNEQTAQSESKRKRKKGKGKKARLGATGDGNFSPNSKDNDGKEAEDTNLCPETQIVNRKDLGNEDLNMKKISLVPDKQSDSPGTTSTCTVATGNPNVDADLVMPPEIEVIEKETLKIGKKSKTHRKKRKKSPNVLGDGLEHVWENGLKQTSVNQLEKKHAIDCSENGSIGVPVGHAMPAQDLEKTFIESTATESNLKGSKRKRRKKLKESLCKVEDQKEIEIETKMEEVPVGLAMPAQGLEKALNESTATVSDLKGSKRKRRKKLKESLCKFEDQKEIEIETKMEEVPVGLAMPAQGLEKALNESTATVSDLKGSKGKKRKKLKESLCKYEDQKDIKIETKMEEVPVGHAMPAQGLEKAFDESTGTVSDFKGSKRKRRKKLKESLCKFEDQKDIKMESKMEEVIPYPSNLAVAKDNVTSTANVEENNFSRTSYSSFQGNCISNPKKKLLVLDLNGILVDVVQNPGKLKPHARVSGKGVFRRPFCDEFLDFCFRTFNVGIWSSRIHKNMIGVVNFLIGKEGRRKLLFCWDRKKCTITKFKTLENKGKPIVLKELRKLWDKLIPQLPWKKGEYDESNTLLVDDSPYKALRNPANTAIFPYSYQYTDAGDCSLGCGGDIREYLERLAAAENVQKFVEDNPFGQPAITVADPHWEFYSQIIEDKTLQTPLSGDAELIC